jgi:hypothetical protein
MAAWKVVSFHTDDALYKGHIERLKDSLVDHGIDNYIEEIPRSGGWIANVDYKPVFILKCLEMFDENIVWLDADAVVQQYPVLFDDIDADIAVHYKSGKELLSGTMYFSNTEKSKELLREWIALRETKNGVTQPQQVLEELLRGGKYLVHKLPAPYTLIFDHMRHLGPPVIEHFQASRKGRKLNDIYTRGV